LEEIKIDFSYLFIFVIFLKAEFIGCRLNVDTETCEQLKRSWGYNPTIVDGYSYAIKRDVKINNNSLVVMV
jgi:hypothetical protein